MMRKGYEKKASYKDSFEDLYLRHDYLRKIEVHDEVSMAKYEKICRVTARIMHGKHRITYEKVSFYYEDILNITRSYLAAFLGLYSFDKQPVKLMEFQNKFLEKNERYPDQAEIEKKERNNLINFLRQRLQTLSVFCERKSRNIVVGKGDHVFFAYTALTVPASDDAILENPEVFGYRPLTSKEVADIKNKKNLEGVVDSKGFKIISVVSHSQLPIPLFVQSNALSGNGEDTLNEIIHERLTPSVEDSIMEIEEEDYVNAIKEKFGNFSDAHKKQMLANFIKQNKNSSYLSEEISAARKMLKTLSNVV